MARAIASAIAEIEHMTAVIDALLLTVATIDLSVVLVQHPDFAPSEALPFLAQQDNVDGIKGFALCSTDSQRRELLNSAIELHRTKGTPYAIKRAITAALGYEVVIRERTGLNHNGEFLRNGTKRHAGGAWYNFSVEVFYTGEPPTANQVTLITQLIYEYKNARSRLFDLKFTKK